ncbi:MAG TPA: DUF2244 domain-containing protein [Limnobacter sp.]|nr:DUF2244 domain-containing protein [Limnobacter sp.]
MGMIPEGSSLRLYNDSNQTSTGLSQRWVFKRNCALTPRQLLNWYLSLCGLTMVIATGFAWMGFWIVLPFAGLELLLVGIAFVIYARHAADYEAIELSPGQLRLVWADGSRLTEIEWSPQWAKLSYNGRYKAPLVISHRGQQVKMGKFIAEKDKSALHLQLRSALARAAYPV